MACDRSDREEGSLARVYNAATTRTKGTNWQPMQRAKRSSRRSSRADGKVIVDFWAEWCGPCHAVAPVLDRIADEHDVKLVKVNIDEQQDLAQRYGVASIPFMVLFEDGAAAGVGDRRDAEGLAREGSGSGGAVDSPLRLSRCGTGAAAVAPARPRAQHPHPVHEHDRRRRASRRSSAGRSRRASAGTAPVVTSCAV